MRLTSSTSRNLTGSSLPTSESMVSGLICCERGGNMSMSHPYARVGGLTNTHGSELADGREALVGPISHEQAAPVCALDLDGDCHVLLLQLPHALPKHRRLRETRQNSQFRLRDAMQRCASLTSFAARLRMTCP